MADEVEGYRVTGSLGEGGSARVWEAVHEASGATVALKVLKEADDGRRLREVAAMRRVDHTGVVKVLDSGVTASGLGWIAMERVDGAPWRGRAPSPAEAWRVARAAAGAVGAAHAAGVLHRDLTPSNVLVGADGAVRVADFGVARIEGDPGRTRTGELVGTPAYLAPERWFGGAADVRTDIFGLGAVLYEALTGRAPWSGEPADVMHAVASGAPPSVGLSPTVDAFLARCLARDPAARPANAATFIAEGDVAFGTDRSAWGAAILVALGIVAIGYRGSPRPWEWIHVAGPAVWLPIVVAAASAWRPRLPIGLAPVLGFVGAAFGFAATLRSVDASDPTARFLILQVGLAESLANVYVACGAAAVVLAARAGTTAWRWNRRLGVVGVPAMAVALAVGDAGAVLMGVVTVVLLAQGPRRPASALAAVTGLALAVLARTLAADADLWSSGLPYAARVVALGDARGRDVGVLGTILFCGVGSAALIGWRPRLSGWIAANGVAAVLLAGGIAVESRAIHRELGPLVAVWSELDLPAVDGEALHALDPVLQVGRGQVRVDGAAVMPRAALATTTGLQVLASALGPHLAPGAALAVAMDRSLPWSEARPALTVAADLGVTVFDVWVLPGGVPPRVVAADLAVVLPGDLASRRWTDLPEDGPGTVGEVVSR